MTPQLETAISAIQPLSPLERKQLLQILIQDELSSTSGTELKTVSTQFRQGNTLKQLLETQTPTTVYNLEDITADFWPEEDSLADFLVFLQR
jgi:hypothetical protein